MRPRAYVIDDGPLAVERLVRMLKKTARVEVAGSSTDPVAAVEWLRVNPADVVFLDIEMPEMQGFDVLARLESQPYVVFTTAFERYALRAFEVHSIDYLLKPIDAADLDRALDKLDRILGGVEPSPDLAKAVRAVLKQSAYPSRLPSRVGDRVEFVDLSAVTHFYVEDKLTMATVHNGKAHAVDGSINELEGRLDPGAWLRIHRSTLLNLAYVQEVHGFFGGRLVVRLKDERRTELQVARERVGVLKERLGM
ncbi:MAG: response regulator transcription factor [Acidobacteria bacterium]|nr:response regulator transcription factor [Acidobacteriota bacterium]